MRFPPTRSMIFCVASSLSLAACESLPIKLQLEMISSSRKPAPVVIDDSFCQLYQKVIAQKGDGTIQATDGAKRRIAANEVAYRCLCLKWDDAACKQR